MYNAPDGLFVGQMEHCRADRPIIIKAFEKSLQCQLEDVTVVQGITSSNSNRGHIACRFVGGKTWTGPAGSFVCDASTAYMSFARNTAGGYLLAGGATVEILDTYGYKGDNLTSAASMLTDRSGNFHLVTAANAIDYIQISEKAPGSELVLQFAANPTLTHQAVAAPGAGYAKLWLAGGINFVAAAGDMLTLIYDGTDWREKCRSIN